MTSLQVESSTEISPQLDTNSEDLKNTNISIVIQSSQEVTLFQLLKDIYFQLVNTPISKIIWPLKIRGFETYLRLKESLLQRKISDNVYNLLILTWLDLNMPFSAATIRFGSFKASFRSKIKEDLDEVLLTRFYQNAISVWNSLVDPSLEEIKNACLMIVARTSAFHEEDLNEILANTFLTLINSQEELVSLEEFIYLVKNYPGSNWKEQEHFRKICEGFYVFGKRFILVDFPFSKVGVSLSKLFHIYCKDQFTNGLNKSFDFLEEKLDQINQKYDRTIISQPNFSKIKNIYLQRSLIFYSKLRQSKDLLLLNAKKRVKKNKIYSSLDNVLKIEQNYSFILRIFEDGKNLIKSNLFASTHYFSIYYKKRKNNINIFIEGFGKCLRISKKIEFITSKYKRLKDLTIKISKDFLKIKVPLEILKNYSIIELKGEIVAFYKELKNLNFQKVQFYTYQLYTEAINQLKSHQSLAQRSTIQNRVV